MCMWYGIVERTTVNTLDLWPTVPLSAEPCSSNAAAVNVKFTHCFNLTWRSHNKPRLCRGRRGWPLNSTRLGHHAVYVVDKLPASCLLPSDAVIGRWAGLGDVSARHSWRHWRRRSCWTTPASSAARRWKWKVNLIARGGSGELARVAWVEWLATRQEDMQATS